MTRPSTLDFWRFLGYHGHQRVRRHWRTTTARTRRVLMGWYMRHAGPWNAPIGCAAANAGEPYQPVALCLEAP